MGERERVDRPATSNWMETFVQMRNSNLLSTGEPEEAADRRSENRHRTVLRVAVLEADGRSQLCTIRNVSEAGLKARLFREVTAGQDVRIRLREDEWLQGSVVWCQDGFAGIKFGKPLSRLGLTEAFGFDEQRRPRVPRIKVHGSGSLRVGASTLPVTVRDISPRGAGISLEGALSRGPVCLILDRLGSIPGQVCWVSAGEAGIMFNQVLPIEALAAWIGQNGEPAER